MGLKILTVDDSKTIRMIIAKAFKAYDCEALEAANGVEGLAVAARERPDIIILDLTMPIMDGYETLTKLKSDPELKNIPVVMLTAEAGRDNVLRIAKQGVRDYLVKPFKEELVVDRIGRIVDLRPKNAAVARVRRFDHPLNLLVVDDKPAIAEQIREGLRDTPWTIHDRAQTAEAVDLCSRSLPDLILVSLSLADAAGYSLFRLIRASARTKNVPLFGMCVKTASDDQARAQQMGFNAIVTKPIDFEDLKAKITRALSLDTSYKYFQHRDGALVLAVPGAFGLHISNEVASQLRSKVAEGVDAGLDSFVFDLSAVQSADINLIRLGLQVVQICQELALRLRMIGSPAVALECKKYEETKDWSFVNSFQEAISAQNRPASVAA
jgi:two-component system, cell cycle response regulator